MRVVVLRRPRATERFAARAVWHRFSRSPPEALLSGSFLAFASPARARVLGLFVLACWLTAGRKFFPRADARGFFLFCLVRVTF